MENSKRTIAIVCGGDSSEHDVSLRSGQGLYSFFDKERYHIYLVDVKGTDWHVALDNGETIDIDKNDFSFVKDGKHIYFDYAYITIHGQPGENGVMQGYFDLIHLPYSTSGVLVEAMTFDKYVLNNYLRGFGVNVADSILLRRGEQYDEDEIAERIGMPCFVKPAADGSSFGVSKVKNADQLAPALRVAFMESNEVMIEGFLDGTEISQGIYKTAEKTVVLPATEVVTSNEFFDYDAKYNGQVQEITPARLSPETAEEVAKTTSRIYDILHANGIILPYSTSGVLVEAMTFDKYVLNNYLRGFGVNVADSILLRRGEQYDEDEIAERIGMPCFVKPAADGSSFGVSKVKNADQLAPALRVAFMESNEVMIEGFLDGTEISQGIYKTAEKTVVLPATEVVTSNEFFDYDAKYNGQVQEITPARLSPETAEEVAKTTSRIYDILHANGIIRIDYIISKDKDGKDKVNMLEINTTPGMTVTSFIPQQVRAAGLDIKDVLSDIVENQF